MKTDQRLAVIAHLDELLASAGFVQSKRLSSFLHFIVLQTIDEADALLKERTIGIAVFERPLDWEPKVDTIVRTEARRLRKKLAAYYSASGEIDRSVRIDVPTGGYVPVFHFDCRSGATVAVGTSGSAPDVASAELNPSRGRLPFWVPESPRSLSRRLTAAVFLALLCIPLAFSFFSSRSRVSAHVEHFENAPFTWGYGHEFSPAISPDEQQIAYVWEKGDGQFGIYLKSVQGGNPHLLTQDRLPDLNPRWSPTGKEITFLRVHSTQADVVIHRMSDGAERLVASIATQLGSWTGDPSPLVGDLGPAWTPDGKSLIMMDLAPHAPVSGLVEITLSNGIHRQLTRTRGSIEDFLPRVSPDGQMLAFVRTTTHGVGNICLLNLQTLKVQSLTDEKYSINGLAWSDTPDQLIFSSNRKGTFQLWTVQTSDGSIQELNTYSTTALDPQIARHEKWIAYVRANESWDVDRIQIGKGIVTPTPERFIASSGRNRDGQYSPDGSHIAFVSDRSGSWEIWLCDAACSNPRKLTNFGGPWLGGLSWSPDSKQLAFDARPNGHSAIYRMPIANPSPEMVERNNFEERLPTWSNDGSFLFFNSDRDGSISIWKRDLVTGAVQNIANRASYYDAHELDHAGTLLLGRLDGTLWRMSDGGIQSAQMLPGVAVDPVLGWTTHAGAVYYCDQEDGGWIRILERSPTGTKLIARIQAQLPDSSESLDISPDGHFLLLTVIDHSSSNIYLRGSATSPIFHEARIRP